MTFIVIFIALIVERFFDCSHLRHWQWFSVYQQWIIQHRPKLSPHSFIIACIAPLLIITGLIEYSLSGWLYDLLKLIFSVIILLYCFGPRNLWIDSYASINALLHDELTLATQKIQTAFGPIDKSHDAQVIHKQLINKIYTESYQRIFSVVFWFALLGPVG